MRLKQVRIFGFKTFADRTEFSLDGGIVSVVGPNGCGKSNLVDAILWGLGEGNARHLRAGIGQDVIFSGSSRRKGLGFAEVLLLFDNEDGALPVESAEVSVSRRLTRSGESEYAINRRSCRLRDVYELLADSGLGRAGYSIVGQKEIDAALAASPEDRRAWVDEAAGVQRYRARKVESLRRLLAAQEHLSRVADILRELEAQREPLRLEAETAIRYKSIQRSLREIETGLLVNELCAASRDIEDLWQRIEKTTRQSETESRRADELEEQVSEAGRLVSEIESEMDAVRAIQQGSITAMERADAALRLAQQRIESLDQLGVDLASEETNVRRRIDEAEAELREAQAEAASDEQESARIQAAAEIAGQGSKALASELTRLDADLVAARAANAALMRQEAERRHRLERLGLAKREEHGIVANLSAMESEVEDAQEKYDAACALLEQSRSLEGEARLLAAALEQEEAERAKLARRVLQDRAILEGRRRGIEATLDAHEGISQGAKAVLDAARKGLLKAKYVPVGQAVETEKKFALAIETALGGAAHDLIVAREEDAKSAIEWLKQNRAGRATFQPLPLMRRSDPGPEMRRVLANPGVLGRASELVDCLPEHRPVIDGLLGRQIVVETLDDGLALARTSGWSRIVTLDGEVLHSGGAVTGGRQAKQGYGLVQRKSDLAEVVGESEHLDAQLQTLEAEAGSMQDRKLEMEAQIAAAKIRTAERDSEVSEVRSLLHALSDELKAMLRGRERLAKEIADLTQPEEPLGKPADIQELERRRDAVLKDLASKSADSEQAEIRMSEARARAERARLRLAAAQRRSEQARHAEDSRKSRLQRLEPDREKALEEISTAQRERSLAAERRQEAETRLQAALARKRECLEKSLLLAEEAKAARSNASALAQASHQAELSRARADSRRAAALERLMEEYGIGEDEAAELEGSFDIPPDAPSLVARLRREMRAMGDVNLGADEAFERLSARLSELSLQQEDILLGIQQVEKGIRELDGLTRERFEATFAALQTAFSEMFEKLFGGGTGAISLTDPQHLLETGIDIDVTLPGKRRQPLNLLSGGERALCASAFLFALLKVKPSPLVVLDEVDAPLDGRNVERFAKTLHEFTDTTQFIVITHNPATIESADVWLGVSMQEPGVSTLIPMRAPEAAAV